MAGIFLFNGGVSTPPLYMVIPFATLLLTIAILPLVATHWWEKRRDIVVSALVFLVSLFYFFTSSIGVIGHTILDYASFVSLIGSLYIVSGGIHLRVRGTGTPMENFLFLFFGAVVTNFLGTTGASMLLIRPFLAMNKKRLKKYHIVFFIFIVGNLGGLLTPIGDPPLGIGYFLGVPFLTPLKNFWPIWVFTVGLVLAVFYLVDLMNFKKESSKFQHLAEELDVWKFSGTRNLFFLGVIIGTMFAPSPLREILMVTAGVCSFLLSRKTHKMNNFNTAPLKEVAILFFGIFITMAPTLEILQSRDIGLHTPTAYFFVTGAFSAVLDNAPTYVALLASAMGQQGMVISNPANVLSFIQDHPELLMAISAGAVFFGAMTYIGNAPNLLIKEVAEKSNAPVPTFVGYIGYSILILLPILLIAGLVFFR